MKTVLILISMLAPLVGCGTEDLQDPQAGLIHVEDRVNGALGQGKGRRVDLELAPGLDLYLSVAPNRGKFDELVELRFGDPGPGKLGDCQVDPARRKITISPVMSGKGSYLAAVVAHELGHCLHDKEHSGDPDSLMYKWQIEDQTYWDEHLSDDIAAMFR